VPHCGNMLPENYRSGIDTDAPSMDVSGAARTARA
jgi:hypothetical protein